jgi:hypothetical protein
MSAVPHSSQVDRSVTQSHYAAEWEALFVKNAIAFYGNLAASPGSRTDPDAKTVVAQWDHEEVHQSCVPTHPLVQDASPPNAQP